MAHYRDFPSKPAVCSVMGPAKPPLIALRHLHREDLQGREDGRSADRANLEIVVNLKTGNGELESAPRIEFCLPMVPDGNQTGDAAAETAWYATSRNERASLI